MGIFRKRIQTSSTGAGLTPCSRFSFVAVSLSFLSLLYLMTAGCTLTATRPVQEMSDTAAAIRAAREVQADTLAPELFRQSREWFFKATREYKFKNFKLAAEYSEKARFYAESAEFEAIRNGGNRTGDAVPSDPLSSMPTDATPPPPAPAASGASKPYEYPTPTGTPADVFDQRKAAEDAAKNPKGAAPNPAPVPVPVPTP